MMSGGRAASIAKAAVPLILLALLVRGAIYVFVDLRPADRVHLLGSTWEIVELDGRPVEPALILRFDASRSSGDLASDCLRLRFEYDLDSDDIGIEFFNLAASTAACPSEAGVADRVRLVLERIEAWSAPSDNRIEFFDGAGPPLFARPLLAATR